MQINRTLQFAKWNLLFCLSIALIVSVAGCRSPRRSQPVAGELQNSSAEVEHGRRVFMQHCHMCHPGGEGGLGPSINDKPLPAFAMKTQVRIGAGVMPSFDKHHIAAEDLDALTAYLKALRKQSPQPTALRK